MEYCTTALAWMVDVLAQSDFAKGKKAPPARKKGELPMFPEVLKVKFSHLMLTQRSKYVHTQSPPAARQEGKSRNSGSWWAQVCIKHLCGYSLASANGSAQGQPKRFWHPRLAWVHSPLGGLSCQPTWHPSQGTAWLPAFSCLMHPSGWAAPGSLFATAMTGKQSNPVLWMQPMFHLLLRQLRINW